MAKRRDGSVKVMGGAERRDESRFPTEGACREFLVGLRWPDGYDCPSCGHTEPPRITARGYLHCRDCQGEISPTAGTLFTDATAKSRSGRSRLYKQEAIDILANDIYIQLYQSLFH